VLELLADMQWNSPYTINREIIQRLPTLANDQEWNRTLYPQEKAKQLMEVFQEMQPCILKCMLYRFGNAMEMAANYLYLYNECCNVICKNMIKHPNYPASMFSSAVHVHVTQQGLFSDPRWRVISAVFEYTSMEISAKLKERDMQKQEAMKKVSMPQSPPDFKPSSMWEWMQASDKHPGIVLKETHAKVHEYEQKLQSILAMLENLVNSAELAKKTKEVSSDYD
jgi:hypothetical protein